MYIWVRTYIKVPMYPVNFEVVPDRSRGGLIYSSVFSVVTVRSFVVINLHFSVNLLQFVSSR